MQQRNLEYNGNYGNVCPISVSKYAPPEVTNRYREKMAAPGMIMRFKC